ncbi:MAG: laccase domain-containing protein [Patescibacteria group bacterium]
MPNSAYFPFKDSTEIRIFGKRLGDLGIEHVAQVASDLQIGRVLHPSTDTFNGEVCTEGDFISKKRVGNIEFVFDYPADGVLVPPHSMAWFRTADCPTIITKHSDGRVIAAHAGRFSLIDQASVSGGPKRKFPSVVDAILDRLFWPRRDVLSLNVFSCCGVGPISFLHSYNHPIHGKWNRLMNAFIRDHYGADCFLGNDLGTGALDLHQLIRNQFAMRGIPADQIQRDKIDTANDAGRWFSRCHGDRTGHNTVLVIRRD